MQHVVVAGGSNEYPWNEAYDTIVSYSMTTGNWTMLDGKLPWALGNIRAVGYKNTFLTVGGFSKSTGPSDAIFKVSE